MASARWFVFPDRRELAANADRAHKALFDGPSPDEAMPFLHRIDWVHPALVVYREDGEDRWSQVTLGLSLRPELDEA